MESTFNCFRRLEYLNLAGNPIGSIPASISHLSILYELNLSRTSMLAINYTEKARNNNLQVIKFEKMPNLQMVNDCAFCNFVNLKNVSFAYSSQLSVIHENAFGNVIPGKVPMDTPPKIAFLNLNNCSLSNVSVMLLDWQHVHSVYLNFNPFTCDCGMEWYIDFLKKHNR